MDNQFVMEVDGTLIGDLEIDDREKHFSALMRLAMFKEENHAALQLMTAMLEAWCPADEYVSEIFASQFNYVLNQTKSGNLDVLVRPTELTWR